MTAPPPTARRRVLLAPVTVSPTKPLTPSHLKLLLSLDILHRATATFADVDHVYHPLAHAGSRQVAGFWEYLDRRHPELAVERCAETEIGELYGRFQQAERVDYTALAPYVRRAATGWAHPASLRLQQIWEEHFRLLGMRDPALGRTGPAPMPADELIELLVRHHLCVDGRPYGAPVYLDPTPAGLPLRMIVGADGHANYLLSTLAELVPQLRRLDEADTIVLAHDVEIRADYRTIAHVLTGLGARVERLEFPRVPLDGVARSTRYGGWQGYTVDALAEPLVAEYGESAFALGMRLYLIAGLGRTAPDSFSVRHLRRWTQRADRLLAVSAEDPGDLSVLAGRLPYVDPYRLVTALLSREPVLPASRLLGAVLGTQAAVPDQVAAGSAA